MQREDWILIGAGLALAGTLIGGLMWLTLCADETQTQVNVRMDAVRREREARVQTAKLTCWEIGGTPVQSLQNGEVILCAIAENPTCRGCGTRRDR